MLLWQHSCSLHAHSGTRRRSSVRPVVHRTACHCLPGPAQQPGDGPKCYLMGCGLGPQDYLTVKAARLLQAGGYTVVYDDLGSEGALELVPPTCERIYVGKRGGRPSKKQPEIDALLVGLCRAGKTVVRLKGGCPSVFSRVSSEIAALEAAGCAYELVPGVSSALAAPLLAGFPLTDVDVGTSFAVVSGHEPERTDWRAFDRIPTLVVLMGGAALPTIAGELVAQGREASTPVCVIRSAGVASDQKVWRGTLASAAAKEPGREKLSPCVVVIGKVVGLAGQAAAAAAEAL